MTRREILKNNSATTLSADITSTSATSFTVTDGSVFPATGDFHLLVDTEIMLCTARSTNTLTVVRGQEGTTAATHSNGAAVTLIVTAGVMQQYGRDNVPGFDGSRPPFRLCDASGDTLTSASFTTVNLSTSSISDVDSAIVLRKHGDSLVGENVTALARSYTNPATVIAGIHACIPQSSSSALPSVGAGFRESSTGKLLTINLTGNGSAGGTISVYKYTNPTTFDSGPVARVPLNYATPVIWFKCEDDGTTLKLSISHDGDNWIQIFSEARTTFMAGGPNQFVFGSNNYQNNFDTLASLVSWKE